VPFVIEQHQKNLELGDLMTLNGTFMFCGLIAVALYLRADLGGEEQDCSKSLEYLTLDHQRCVTMYETLATATTILFTGILLAPVFAGTERLRELTLAKLIWTFYFFSGIVVWLLRPCTARAAFIRAEVRRMKRVPDAQEEMTPPCP
jgi:hypothetical protein